MTDSSLLSTYARRFFSGTFVSRLTGMGRDLAMGFAFGDHPSVAAFLVAFRFSNLLRRLLGEGPFQSAFIPYFEGLRVQDPAKAIFFFRRLTILIALLLVVVSGLAETLIAVVLSQFSISEGSREILILTGWLFPAIIFICLYGLNISLLQCHDCFFLASVAPVVSNVIWILAALFLKNREISSAMPVLAQCVAIGFCGQWLVTLPSTLKRVSGHWKEWLSFNIPSEVKGLAKSFAFGAIGVGAMQINAFVDALFARSADLKGPVYLWYSIRLEQLALAIFGIACVTTIVPRLSRAVKSGDKAQAYSLFSFSAQRILAIMVPCTLAIITLGGASVNLLYGHGEFSQMATSQTTLCLWAYALALLPSALVILLSSLFYAENDFRRPTFISLVSVGVNLFLNAFFVFVLHWGAISIAIATSASAWVNCLILYSYAKKGEWKLQLPFARILKLCLAALFATLCTAGVEFLMAHQTILPLFVEGFATFTRSSSLQLLHFSLLFLTFSGGLALFVLLFKNEDLLELFYAFVWRKKPKIVND